MKVRLVILPPAVISKQAATLAKDFSKFGPSNFVVDNRKLLPHITLCRFFCERKDIPTILIRVRQTLQQASSFVVATKKVSPVDDGSIYWEMFTSTNLKRLRKMVHEAIKEFNTEPAYAKLKSAYHPHITLIGFKEASNAGLAVGKSKSGRRTMFRATKVAFTESGPYGQVPKIIKEFRLK